MGSEVVPELPLLDGTVLVRLREELDSDVSLWQLFVRNYTGMLQQRIQRLRLCLTTGDVDGAMDAILSLRTSSEMVGAVRLAALAWNLQAAIRDATRQDTARALPGLASTHLGDIRRCATQTRDRLRRALA